MQGTIPREWEALAQSMDEISLADNSLTGALPPSRAPLRGAVRASGAACTP